MQESRGWAILYSLISPQKRKDREETYYKTAIKRLCVLCAFAVEEESREEQRRRC
jgi:hypothetical protein